VLKQDTHFGEQPVGGLFNTFQILLGEKLGSYTAGCHRTSHMYGGFGQQEWTGLSFVTAE
jgi:hypothetical protein